MKSAQVAIGFMVLLLAGCSAPGAALSGKVDECRGAARPMAQVQLLFGTLRTAAAPVAATEWAVFLAEEVTPRFPAGLTVFTGYGQWRDNKAAIISEESRLLMIWYEPGLRSEADIEAIRAAYKLRFAQDSVMRIDSTACVAF
jgi:hypothetical protein